MPRTNRRRSNALKSQRGKELAELTKLATQLYQKLQEAYQLIYIDLLDSHKMPQDTDINQVLKHCIDFEKRRNALITRTNQARTVVHAQQIENESAALTRDINKTINDIRFPPEPKLATPRKSQPEKSRVNIWAQLFTYNPLSSAEALEFNTTELNKPNNRF